MTVGFPDSGAYLEHRLSGIHAVSIQGLSTGTLDISDSGWGHLPGVDGERLHLYDEEGAKKVQWTEAKGLGAPLTWYKTTFDAPEGDNPVAVNLTTMSKGLAYVNGRGIGRYWVSLLSPLGMPSQAEYHIPRSYLKPKDNLLVLFEECHGNPDEIRIVTANRDRICTFITEFHPPHIKTFVKDAVSFRSTEPAPKASLKCPNYKKITAIEFASFGNPVGNCGLFTLGTCNSASSQKVVEDHCLGKTTCEIPVDRALFDKPNEDPCKDIKKALAVQAWCSHI